MKKEPLIDVKNLTAKYGDSVILSEVDLEIYPNEVTVILGGSGCGKTTLLKNIVRLEEPAEGVIKIFGDEVTGMDENDFNRVLKRIGMLFQNGALLNSIPIYDNISIPLEQHTDLTRELIDNIIDVKLGLVNLKQATFKLPSELSGGMRKRAALARAIALDPDLLFCDEPSAGLDPLTSYHLDKLILKLKNQLNMTIVIVTHELASIKRIADRIVFLDKGRILFTGTVNDALESGVPAVETFFGIE